MKESHEVEKPVSRWSVFGSVVMILAGLLAIVAPLETSIRIVIILAWILIFNGIGHLIAASRSKSLGNLVWDLLSAIVNIVIGLYLILNPTLGLAPLTFVVAVLFLLNGIFEFSFYLKVRSTPRSVGILLNAILSFILGCLIFQHWLSSTLWSVGTIVGISFLLGGISRLALTTGTHRVHSRSLTNNETSLRS
jgi:uncharacterized membrane protein HdeD (DUF308 family)